MRIPGSLPARCLFVVCNHVCALRSADCTLLHSIICCQVRRKLMNTRRRMEEMLNSSSDVSIADGDDDWYRSEEELAQPLLAVYW